MSGEIFPADFFRALAALARRRSAAGGGERAWPRPGLGLPGQEHRPWRAGDDLRLVDWRASARSRQVQVRLREEERGGALLLVLDRSASLAPGGRRRRDLDQRRLALALGWLALEAGARVGLVLPGQARRLYAGFHRRRDLQQALEDLPAPAGPDPASLPEAGPFPAPRPRLVVLGDPWAAPAWWRAVGALAARCREAEWACLLEAGELAPPADALELVGAEDGERLRVHPGPEGGAWGRRWQAWLRAQSRAAVARGFRPCVLPPAPPRRGAAAILRLAEEEDLV